MSQKTPTAEPCPRYNNEENRKLDNPRIQAIGKAKPPLQLTQEETFRLIGYSNPRTLKIFLNSGIDFRRFYLDPENFSRFETPDELNRRYLQGACIPAAGQSTPAWSRPE